MTDFQVWRDKLRGHGTEPSPNLWHSLENRLQSNKKQTSIRRNQLFLAAASVFLILTLSFLAAMLSSDENGPQEDYSAALMPLIDASSTEPDDMYNLEKVKEWQKTAAVLYAE